MTTLKVMCLAGGLWMTDAFMSNVCSYDLTSRCYETTSIYIYTVY